MIDRRRAALAGLAAVPLLLLASACKDDGSSPFGMSGYGGSATASATVNGAAAAAASPSTQSPLGAGGGGDGSGSLGDAPSSSGSDAKVLSGTWTGQYVCAQGTTKLTLLLEGAGSGVAGTFKFTGLSGTDTPSGSYTLGGTLADGKVTLHGETWLSQPSGYVMVDLEVTGITSTTLSGTVDGAGCTTFQVIKTGD